MTELRPARPGPALPGAVTRELCPSLAWPRARVEQREREREREREERERRGGSNQRRGETVRQ